MYGKCKGRIEFHMTKDDFKTLWFRDKGWLLKEPSIDRIDSKGHYILSNCRFIEMRENSRLGSLGKIASEATRAKLRLINPPEISISEFEGLKEDISNICKQALLGQGGEK
jgi:hypothetical protein